MGIKIDEMCRITLSVAILCWVSIGNLYAIVQNTGSFPAESMIHRMERLNEMGKTTGQTVSYNATEIRNEKAPAFDAETNNMEEWLYKSLIQSKFTYEKRNNKHYLVVRNKQATPEPEQTQQVSVLSGRITDVQNEPLIGVNIVEKGTSNGTVTDIDGRYSLPVPADAVIVFSYIGYTGQEVPRNGRNIINVTLGEDSELLDEVVVVGYGTQKKVNLTGSVAVLSGEDIIKRPITNVSSGLQGLAPGLTVIQNRNGGLPGQSAASITVRGIGTVGNNNPLVLIDGVVGDMNIINPDDIESISVLKDAASAAIYGNRAANGVILITTKDVSAKEKSPSVNFSAYLGIQQPTKLPDMVDSPTYMRWENEAKKNVGETGSYSEENILAAINRTDPNYFANTNWVEEIFKSSAPQQNYNVSIDGKSQHTGYLLSYGFLKQDGLLISNATGSKRHNVRLKLNTTALDRLHLDANISYIDRKYYAPPSGFSIDGGLLYNTMRTRPTVPVRFTDGGWGYGGGQSNQVAILTNGGSNTFSSQEFTGNFGAKIDLLKGWNASATYSIRQSNSLREILNKTIHHYRPDTEEIWYSYNPTNSYENRDYVTKFQTISAQTDYDLKTEDHNIHVMAGFQQEWEEARSFTARRDSLVTEKDPVLNFGSENLQSTTGSGDQWAMRSGFGRINYNYAERYLLEANIRYDLTSRFIKSNRSEWFPSFSAGWRISEESFMSEYKTFLDQLKVRVSWGILGNQYVSDDNYPYISTIGIVNVPNLGTTANDGYTENKQGNPALLWEKSYNTNIGIDVAILNNRLSLSADYFVKNTEKVIIPKAYPALLGNEGTMYENGGIIQNKGWEIQIDWKDRIGKDLGYGLSAYLSDVKNKITQWGETEYGSYTIRREGDPLDAFYGLIADGIAMPWEFEKYNPATGKYENPLFPIMAGDAGLVQPGDIKYKDLDDSGSIDLENDRKVLGSQFPRYQFSVKGYLDYKGIDFSFLIQGVGKANGYIYGPGRHVFQDQSTYPQWFHSERYQASNPNPNAAYPRFTYNQSYNQRFSTFWLEDASYLRLKNIQIGYTFPEKWTKRLRVDRCRIYSSADNLFTITNYFSQADPEIAVQAGGNYPQVQTFVFGVNITFN